MTKLGGLGGRWASERAGVGGGAETGCLRWRDLVPDLVLDVVLDLVPGDLGEPAFEDAGEVLGDGDAGEAGLFGHARQQTVAQRCRIRRRRFVGMRGVTFGR